MYCYKIYFTTLQLNGSQSSDDKYWVLGFPKKAVKGIKALPKYARLLREPNIPSSEATMWLRNIKIICS